jgi:mono/diheme cytochrome c family protein
MRLTRRRLTALAAMGSTAAMAALWWALGPLPRSSEAAPPAPGKPQPSQPSQPSASAGSFDKAVTAFLGKHCIACHGNANKKGGVNLEGVAGDEGILKKRKMWERAVQAVKTGEMPPSDKPRPANADVEAFLNYVGPVLTRTDCSGKGDPGRVTVRRLNRTEYNNTIRDLCGVDFKPAEDFPSDDVGYGFDNIGDVLSLPPLLLEKYLAAAEKIVDKALAPPPPAPKATKHRYGGPALQLTDRKGGGNFGQSAKVLFGAGTEVHAPCYQTEGDYKFRVRAFVKNGGGDGAKLSFRSDGKEVGNAVVKSEEAKPGIFECDVRLKTGQQRITVALLNPTDEKDTEKRRQLIIDKIELEGPFNPPPPQPTESYRMLMTAKDGLPKAEAARDILTRFANRAFRRPATREEVDRYCRLVEAAEKEGETWERGVKLALTAVLVSPHFLFRVEIDPEPTNPAAHFIGEYELASRLSYFLWATMPDKELLDLAAAGKLRAGLDAQVKRMLADPKAASLVECFAQQWLQLRRLRGFTPDPKVAPEFNEDLRSAMQTETELFFAAVMREDRSVLEFLDSDWTYVNERLAKHYGMWLPNGKGPVVKGKEFQRVKVSPDQRGGVLTHASILTITSNPSHTSPVKRGKWILEQILGTPPPPAPPGVPDLPNDAKAAESASLRQRMELHRSNPACAGCHARLDPLGFGFENYDVTGVWRDKDGKFPVDSSGVLPDGTSFKGPRELKGILKGKKDQFVRNLADKLLTYALGRGTEYYDQCAINKIVAAVAANDHKFSTLVLEVVRSEPFQNRRGKTGEK